MRLSLLAVVLTAVICEPARSSEPATPPDVVVNSLGMRFVAIAHGEFSMGSDDGDNDERPRHRVRITRPFHLGVYEVTQREYSAVMGDNPSWFAPSGGGRDDVANLDTADWPVDMVTWLEAAEFCRRLSALDAEAAAGRRYRLPTEAEWEYAARAGTARDADVASRSTTAARTARVGSHPPNAWGLHDMRGNVWEWCADRYDADYYKQSPLDDPQGPPEGTGRVIRGGDYRSPPSFARSANRDFTRESRRDQGNGFRVVLDVRTSPQ